MKTVREYLNKRKDEATIEHVDKVCIVLMILFVVVWLLFVWFILYDFMLYVISYSVWWIIQLLSEGFDFLDLVCKETSVYLIHTC